jgi:hypothetical protein
VTRIQLSDRASGYWMAVLALPAAACETKCVNSIDSAFAKLVLSRHA